MGQVQSDALYYFRTALSKTGGDLPDLEMAWLASLGFSQGDLNYRWYQYFKAGNTLPPSLSQLITTPSMSKIGSSVTYSAEATALFARFTTPPSDTRKGLIDTLIVALKTAGVWAKMDAFYVMAAADAQSAQRNWKADLYNLTPTSSPTFTADRGYTGNGTTAYLNTGYNPTIVGGLYSLNSASASVWSLTTGTDLVGMGSDDAAGFLTIRPRIVGDLFVGRANRAANGQIANTDGRGLYTVNRTTSLLWDGYKNGAVALNVTGATTTGIPNGNVTILRQSALFSSGQMGAAAIGSQLSAGEIASLYSALNTYMVAVGAA